MGEYRTIVADPPWDQQTPQGHTRNGHYGDWVFVDRELPYPTMTCAAIAELPVRSFTARDARLFLWTTNRYLPDAFAVLAAWGFRYRQTLVWHKPDANPVAGSVAPNAEFVIVGVHGSPPVNARMPNAVLTWSRQRHSAKPEAFLDLVESVSPGPYLELFARHQRLGWDTWGNEALEHVTLEAPAAHRLDGCA